MYYDCKLSSEWFAILHSANSALLYSACAQPLRCEKNKDSGTKNSRKATKESNAHASRRTQPPGLAFSCFGAGGDAAGGATAGAEAAAAAAACFCM